MKKKTLSIPPCLLPLLLLALPLEGCAHSSLNQRLDQKVAAEPAGETRAQLGTEADQEVAADRALNPEQRSKLLELGKETRSKAAAMSEEGLKLRMLLIKDLVSASYDTEEVTALEERIKDLEQKKLSEYFKAVRAANVILGRWASRDQRIWTEFDTQFYDQVMMHTP